MNSLCMTQNTKKHHKRCELQTRVRPVRQPLTVVRRLHLDESPVTVSITLFRIMAVMAPKAADTIVLTTASATVSPSPGSEILAYNRHT